MSQASQVDNGKAFEYSIAKNYYHFLKEKTHVKVELQEDTILQNAKRCYDLHNDIEKLEFDTAASKTIDTLLAIEPGLTSESSSIDCLNIRLASDSEGQQGDVRDVIFWRPNRNPIWEIGISAKNNHDAVKHSRISPFIDFGIEWMGHPCSVNYFTEINRIFDKLQQLKRQNPNIKWADLGEDKNNEVYIPLLNAFKKEMLRLAKAHEDAPANLLRYLIGRKAFYKIIKEDRNNIVVIRAFNINGELNKTINNIKPLARTELIKMPSRIIELDFKEQSETTMIMILDEGWQISFRLHNASSLIENSLKFDIQLIGNPPIIFTQHLF